MIIDVIDTCIRQGKEAAQVAAYQELLGIHTVSEDFAPDLIDMLRNAASIPSFDDGEWVVWLQGNENHSLRENLRSVQIRLEDELEILPSTDWAPHVSEVEEYLITLGYHARKPPLPEATDISHPIWEVVQTKSSPSEVRFDLKYRGEEA